MKKVKLFLASSSELKEDRNGFEIFINRKNKELYKDEIFIELVIWEDFLDSMSKTRLQDEYNKVISECDIFLMLYFTKVGKYTEEEFEFAFRKFQINNRPFIFTYFKDGSVLSSEIDEDVISLIYFKKKLIQLGHFSSTYKNIDELSLKFGSQLRKLIDESFQNFRTEEVFSEIKIPKISQQHYGAGDNIGGDKIINY